MIFKIRFKSFFPYVITFFVPILLVSVIAFISSFEAFFHSYKELSWAIVLDLLLITPLAYLLTIRKSSIPNTTILPVFIGCLILGYTILPQSSLIYLDVVKDRVLPFIELLAIIFIVYKIIQVYRSLKQYKDTGFDFMTSLNTVLKNYNLGRIGSILATEISMLYYGFIHWKTPDYKENEFTYHKNTGTRSMLGTFVFLVIIEAWIVHILLVKVNTQLAWILTILSIYSAFQLFGLARSMSKRPYVLNTKKLYLRYGIFAETTIDYNNIKSVKIDPKEGDNIELVLNLSPLASLEGTNVRIDLKTEGTLSGLFGIQRTYTSIMVHVDNKHEFNRLLNAFN